MDKETMVALEDYAEFVDHSNGQIAQELQTGNATIGLISALECLCETLQGRDKVTMEDVDRFEAADLFASATTGLPIGEVVPALEEHMEMNVAMEGVFDKIQNGIASLATSSDVVMSLVSKRIAGIGTLIKVYQQRESDLAKVLNDLGDQVSGKTLNVRIVLSAGEEPVKTAEQYIERLKGNADAFDAVLGTFLRKGPKLQKSMIGTIKSFVDGEYTENMCNTFNYFNQDVVGEMAKDFPNKKESGPVVRNWSAPLMNDNVFYLRTSKAPMDTEDDREIVRRKIDMVEWAIRRPSDYAGGRIKGNYDLENVTVEHVREMLIQVSRIVELLKKYQSIGAHEFEAYRRIASTWVKSFSTGYGAGSGLAVGLLAKNLMGLIATARKIAPPGFAANLAAITTTTVVGAGVGLATSAAFDWLRRKIIGYIFSTMKLQYKITEFIGWMDAQVVTLAIEDANRGFAVIKRYT